MEFPAWLTGWLTGDDYTIAREILERGVAAIYLIAFIAAGLLASVGANVSYQVFRFKRLDRIYKRRCLGTSENS